MPGIRRGSAKSKDRAHADKAPVSSDLNADQLQGNAASLEDVSVESEEDSWLLSEGSAQGTGGVATAGPPGGGGGSDGGGGEAAGGGESFEEEEEEEVEKDVEEERDEELDDVPADDAPVDDAKRRAAGRPISQFDCQIAAIARAHEAAVATRNTGDYEGCGIEVIDPWLPTGSR